MFADVDMIWIEIIYDDGAWLGDCVRAELNISLASRGCYPTSGYFLCAKPAGDRGTPFSPLGRLDFQGVITTIRKCREVCEERSTMYDKTVGVD